MQKFGDGDRYAREVTLFAVSKAAKWVVIMHRDTSPGVWNTSTGKSVRTLDFRPLAVANVAFSPDNLRVVTTDRIRNYGPNNHHNRNFCVKFYFQFN